MVPQPSSSATVESSPTNERFSTVVNGLLGGVVGALLSFVPLSPLLGGAIAGYLEGGRPEDGLTAGAIAGLVVLVPFVFLLGFLLFVLGFAGVPRLFGVVGLLVLAASALYAVGLSVLGGYLGVLLKNGA